MPFNIDHLKSTIHHKNQLGNFNITRKGLDRNGNMRYEFIRQESDLSALPPLPGFRRTKQGTRYTTQSANILDTLVYFDEVVNALEFKWIDIQDESDFHTGTLQEARQWLVDFWIDNPYHEDDLEDMEDYDEEEHHQSILNASPDKLNDKMQGIGFYLVDNF